jgi:PAS domain S-box-containing protein
MFKTIFNSVHMSIVVVDKNFIIHQWNKETEVMYGITAEQVLGKSLINLFPDLKRVKLDNYIKSVFETGKKREIKEKFRKTLVRGELYIDYFISPIMVDNKIKYVSLASKEVTERVRLRHNLQEKNERLSILYDMAKTLFSTLNLEEVLFLILTGITNPKMEGFNRAALFKLDKTSQGRIFTGIMGVGTKSGNEAHKLWKKLLKNPRYFDKFSIAYNNFMENQNPTFNSFVQGLGFFQKDLKKNSRLRGITHFKIGRKRNKPPKILLDFFNVKEFVLVPIYIEKELFGIIYVDNYKSKREFDKSDIEFLELSTNLASMAIQLSKKYEETYESTIRDSLTKLFNHRRFYSILMDILKETRC